MTATTTTFNLTVGFHTEGYVLVTTNCPKAYDYGYTLEVDGTDADERHVLVPDRSLNYQMGRYRSGGFAKVEEINRSIVNWITDQLLEKLHA